MCGLIFGHEHLIRAFENASDVGKDGTFWVCAKLFRQVYILMFSQGEHFFPGFICLLMKKSKTVYKPCFNIIYKEEVPRFIGQHFHFDFEPAPRDETMDLMLKIALEEPERSCLANCECHGCMFHYPKALLDNVKKLGLIRKYSRAPHFRFWVRKIVMLCLQHSAFFCCLSFFLWHLISHDPTQPFSFTDSGIKLLLLLFCCATTGMVICLETIEPSRL